MMECNFGELSLSENMLLCHKIDLSAIKMQQRIEVIYVDFLTDLYSEYAWPWL